MKKTTSFHLEEDILKKIEDYKEQYNLSSRNIALERMLLERDNLLSVQKLLLNNNGVAPVVDPVESKVIAKVDKVEKTVYNSFDTMPD